MRAYAVSPALRRVAAFSWTRKRDLTCFPGAAHGARHAAAAVGNVEFGGRMDAPVGEHAMFGKPRAGADAASMRPYVSKAPISAAIPTKGGEA